MNYFSRLAQRSGSFGGSRFTAARNDGIGSIAEEHATVETNDFGSQDANHVMQPVPGTIQNNNINQTVVNNQLNQNVIEQSLISHKSIHNNNISQHVVAPSPATVTPTTQSGNISINVKTPTPQTSATLIERQKIIETRSEKQADPVVQQIMNAKTLNVPVTSAGMPIKARGEEYAFESNIAKNTKQPNITNDLSKPAQSEENIKIKTTEVLPEVNVVRQVLPRMTAQLNAKQNLNERLHNELRQEKIRTNEKQRLQINIGTIALEIHQKPAVVPPAFQPQVQQPIEAAPQKAERTFQPNRFYLRG